MSLKQQIDNDIKKAMLAKQKEELEALRSIKSMILLAETDKNAGDGISEDKEKALLVKAAKQRKESADIFTQQSRKDLADKELFQLDIINRYLPKQLTEEEVEASLKAIIDQVGAKGPQDMGKVMGVATKSLAGQADGKLISEKVKKAVKRLKWIDILLAICILIGIVQGFRSGFVMELFSLVAVVLGILGGFKLMGVAMIYLDNRFNIDEKVLPYAAFAAVFLIIVIVVNLLGKAVQASISKTVLGSADQVAGGFLGFIRTVFMLSVLMWIGDSLHFKFLTYWSEDTWLYPKVASVAPRITEWVSNVIPFFKGIF